MGKNKRFWIARRSAFAIISSSLIGPGATRKSDCLVLDPRVRNRFEIDLFTFFFPSAPLLISRLWTRAHFEKSGRV